MATVYVGSARSDENGKAYGVQNGDKGMTFDTSGNLLQVHDPAQLAYAYGAGGSKDKIAYIRVSADSITASSIVTVDEEID